MTNKRALICGISGQDGAYLAKLLLEKNYEVIGTSRDSQAASFDNLVKLGIHNKICVITMLPNDFRSTLQTLAKTKPDEVYNLAGPSSVRFSFDEPVETVESITRGVLNLLEAIRFLGASTKFYNASSSECFGDTGSEGADENSPFRPRSPYAVAKCAAHWVVTNYREAYNLYACNGILFNHESPLRSSQFVTRKIVKGVCDIKRGRARELCLGTVDVCRDWGAAEEYVDAMWRMLQLGAAEDFVIATGEASSLRDFVEIAFTEVGLDWTQHVTLDEQLKRPTDIAYSCGNAKRACAVLQWQAKRKMRDVVRMLVDAESAEAGASFAGTQR